MTRRLRPPAATAAPASALVLALAFTFALPPAARADDYTPVQFTISGGISLGNYEAGLNWAVVRLLKLHQKDQQLLRGLPPPKLVAASGASAGNINALIAAIEWCRDDGGGKTPENNAFFQSWIPVGWDGLFAGDRTCVQYCHDQKLESVWAARLGAGASDPCAAACEKDCKLYGGTDCAGGGAAYRADDAVFTRRAFLAVEENFRAVVEKAKYDPLCKLAVGVTTTKFHPTTLDVTSAPPADTCRADRDPPHCAPAPYKVNPDGLTIESSRFVTALRAETRQNQFGYYEHSFQDDHTLGSYLHLPKVPGSDNRVAVDDVLALTEASSAFPGAFGPRKLSYCRVTPKPAPATERCVENEVLSEDYFIDGGAFDNVPLGLGYSLTQAMVAKDNLSTQERHFFYIDPNRRRYLSDKSAPPDPADLAPIYPTLSELVTLAGNFYEVAGKYELQTVARYVWREQGTQPPKLLIAGRLTPITGEYLGAFGAFLARPFRVFDFEVGAYDGAYDYARWACDQEVGSLDATATGPRGRTRARCIVDLLQSSYEELGMSGPGSEESRFVYHSLMARELATWARLATGAEQVEVQKVAAEAKAWSASKGFNPDAAPNPAVKALLTAVGKLHDEEVEAAAAAGTPEEDAKAALVKKHRGDFTYFLQLLGTDQLEGYTESEQELLSHPKEFANHALLGVLSRERQIEHAQNNEGTTRALIGAQLVAISQESSHALGMEVDPSSIPDDNMFTAGKLVSRVLPYRAVYRRPAFSPVRGFNLFNSRWDQLEFSYEPTFGLTSDWALVAPVGAWWHIVSPSSVGVFASPGILWRNHQPLFTGVDLGVRVSKGLVWDEGYEDRFRVGAELGARVLGGKLRVSLIMDDFRMPGGVGFGIGLVDFNGLLYWTVRIIQGA